MEFKIGEDAICVFDMDKIRIVKIATLKNDRNCYKADNDEEIHECWLRKATPFNILRMKIKGRI